MLAIKDVELGGQTYRIGVIDAISQFHIARRLAPILGDLVPLVKEGRANGLEALAPMAASLARLSDADANYCLFGLLKVVQRKQPNGLGWGPVSTGEQLLYADLTMPAMLQLAGQAFSHNLAGFFDALPSDLNAAVQPASAPSAG